MALQSFDPSNSPQRLTPLKGNGRLKSCLRPAQQCNTAGGEILHMTTKNLKLLQLVDLCHDSATSHTVHQFLRQQLFLRKSLTQHDTDQNQHNQRGRNTVSHPENLLYIYLGPSLDNSFSPNTVSFPLKSSNPFELKN